MAKRRVHMARVRRTEVAGEIVAVALELLREDETVELNDGDEFVTVGLEVDPWIPPAAR